VLFDFPLNLPDYLHRVGRTGRVGSKVKTPRVTAFMSHRKDIQMAWKIKDASSKQEAIMARKALQAIQRNMEGKGRVHSPGNTKTKSGRALVKSSS